jgi:hypothetical protein
MPSKKNLDSAAKTVTFDKFWSWLQGHPNCILRAGTPETVLYDDDDLHWHFASESGGTCVVQVLRGKKLVGEILVVPSEIAYVVGEPGEEQEYTFELISETPTDRFAAYHFVLSHGFDAEEQPPTPGRAVH